MNLKDLGQMVKLLDLYREALENAIKIKSMKHLVNRIRSIEVVLVWVGYCAAFHAVKNKHSCVMNGFGVAFLTSAQGPGSPIGNLYYFTWLSFLCNFMLVASVYEDYRSPGVTDKKTEGEEADVAVGTIEDGI